MTRQGLQGGTRGALLRWPWPVQVLLVFAAARAVSAVLLSAGASRQSASPWGPASPDYLSFVEFWDSGWYRRIYDEGYPEVLPRAEDGSVLQNQWAFYPLFPALVRLLSVLTGGGWHVLAPAVATACGFAAALVLYRLFRLAAAHREAVWAVAFVAFLPVAPILQVPYAESLHLLLLGLALYLVATGRYLGAVPVVLLMGLARPAGVPFALLVFALLVRAVLRYWRRPAGPSPEEPSGPAVARLAVLTLAAGAAALLWPATAWVVTGRFDAYLETETAWRGSHLAPFLPWLQAGTNLLGPVGGPVAVLAAAAGCVLLVRLEPVRRLGRVPVWWCASYLLYLAAFWNPQTSTYRILLPLFPLALAAVFAVRSTPARCAVLGVSVLLQAVWITLLWMWNPAGGTSDFPP
ncbi:hypothetical protein [uncultured Arthrobacter sp.]|uniref:hypothetical protein n=1 Tax=uncultured Arthrobacter sp. TaxID=114050 RepID=UPI0025F15C25|nr:hypothetical protein [uncultured Arthrobacter sp.]